MAGFYPQSPRAWPPSFPEEPLLYVLFLLGRDCRTPFSSSGCTSTFGGVSAAGEEEGLELDLPSSVLRNDGGSLLVPVEGEVASARSS